MEILNWILDNIEAIGAGAVMLLGAVAIFAKLTPTPKDDLWVAKLLEFFKMWPKKDKK